MARCALFNFNFDAFELAMCAPYHACLHPYLLHGTGTTRVVRSRLQSTPPTYPASQNRSTQSRNFTASYQNARYAPEQYNMTISYT
jgi:hypothetical protein